LNEKETLRSGNHIEMKDLSPILPTTTKLRWLGYWFDDKKEVKEELLQKLNLGPMPLRNSLRHMRDSFAVWKVNPDVIIEAEELRPPKSIASEKVETVCVTQHFII
jgi:hypothetical protein